MPWLTHFLDFGFGGASGFTFDTNELFYMKNLQGFYIHY
jgi:hypothetical protein